MSGDRAELVKRARYIAEELYAVELLEFHNKNLLSWGGNPCKLLEQKQERFKSLISLLDTIMKEMKQ
jgi:hypothetical protein